MKANEIISNIKSMIEDENLEVGRRLAKLDTLQSILHMAQKDGYIEKKEKAPPPPLNPKASFDKETV